MVWLMILFGALCISLCILGFFCGLILGAGVYLGKDVYLLARKLCDRWRDR